MRKGCDTRCFGIPTAASGDHFSADTLFLFSSSAVFLFSLSAHLARILFLLHNFFLLLIVSLSLNYRYQVRRTALPPTPPRRVFDPHVSVGAAHSHQRIPSPQDDTFSNPTRECGGLAQQPPRSQARRTTLPPTPYVSVGHARPQLDHRARRATLPQTPHVSVGHARPQLDHRVPRTTLPPTPNVSVGASPLPPTDPKSAGRHFPEPHT